MSKRMLKNGKCTMPSSDRSRANRNIRKHIITGVYIVVFLCMCVIGAMQNGSGVPVLAAGNNQEQEEQKQFDITASAGINNCGKQEKDLIVDVTVTNHGEDFSGNIEIVLPVNVEEENSTGVNTAYQQAFSVKAGETKTVSVPMWLYLNSPEMRIHITDEENNILQKEKETISLSQNGYLGMIGVLTEKEDELDYLRRADTSSDSFELQMFSLENFPNQKERLECIDYLLIDNYNTAKWSKEQYQAVTEWVKDGGSLILGTGASGEKTLSGFEEEFLGGTIESVNKDGVAKLNFPDGQVTKALESDLTLTKVKRDSGWIYMIPEDLALDYEEWRTKGLDYTNMLRENLKRDKIGYYTDAETVGSDRGLTITDRGKMPSSLCYGIILGIYAVLVSVVLFVVLKKKRKLEWTWRLVPILSIFCCMIIYVVGSKGRITTPEMIYSRTLEYTGEGETSAITQMDFSVTSPYSETYSMAIPKEETVYSRTNESGSTTQFWWYDTETVDDYMESYKMAIRKEGEQQIVTFKDYASFESAFLGTKKRKVKTEGTYSSDITCEKYEYSGTFTNETGHDIQHAVFLAQGRVYKLGDIKSGETVTILDELKNGFSNRQSAYLQSGWNEGGIGSYCDIPNGVFGGETGIQDTDASAEQLCYAKAISNYFYNKESTKRMMEPKVIGQLSSVDMENSLSTEWGMNCSGVTLGVFPVDVKPSDGEEFVGDVLMEGYGNGEVTGEPTFRSENAQKSVIEYRLAKNETLTGLYLLPVVNDGKLELQQGWLDDEMSFEGEVQAYNYDKKKYETIFKNLEKREIQNVEPYVGENGVVRFRFKIAEDAISSDVHILRPIISATKKVK